MQATATHCIPNPWVSLRRDQLIPVNKAVNEKEQLEKRLEEEEEKMGWATFWAIFLKTHLVTLLAGFAFYICKLRRLQNFYVWAIEILKPLRFLWSGARSPGLHVGMKYYKCCPF
jgi:hypothetical protein